MSDRIKDFRMTVKIANNQIRERRESMGLSAPQAAKLAGVPYAGTWNKLESMKDTPIVGVYVGFGRSKRIGETWSNGALKIAAFFGVDPGVLWPEAMRSIRQTEIEMRVDAEQIAALASHGVAPPGAALDDAETRAAVESALSQLAPRDAEVLRLRFGLDGGEPRTLEEVGEAVGLSKERTRQRAERGMKNIAKLASGGHPVGEVYQP